MPFNFMEAGKFKTWNGLFPFKQLRQGWVKSTFTPYMPYTIFILSSYRMH